MFKIYEFRWFWNVCKIVEGGRAQAQTSMYATQMKMIVDENQVDCDEFVLKYIYLNSQTWIN